MKDKKREEEQDDQSKCWWEGWANAGQQETMKEQEWYKGEGMEEDREEHNQRQQEEHSKIK